MTDASDAIRKFTFVVFAIVLVVCVAASFQYRNEILGGFALRGAQTSFEERVERELGGEVTIEYRDSSERSAMLVVVPPAETWEREAGLERASETVWRAYAEEFAGGGMPIETIVLARYVDPPLKSGHFFGVGDIAARTGVPAPPLHPMYADKGYFDPSKESGPAEAATDE